MSVRGEPVCASSDGSVYFDSGMTIDGDGSPRCYGPAGTQPLDYLANAGHPGNWYGLQTLPDGEPYIQGPDAPAPGYFVSGTAYQYRSKWKFDPTRYLNSELVPFIVVPGRLCHLVKPIVLGCRCVVTFNGNSVEGVVGDVGPDTHLGEASIAMARLLGIGAHLSTADLVREGGVSSGVRYTFFPGEAAPGYNLQAV